MSTPRLLKTWLLLACRQWMTPSSGEGGGRVETQGDSGGPVEMST